VIIKRGRIGRANAVKCRILNNQKCCDFKLFDLFNIFLFSRRCGFARWMDDSTKALIFAGGLSSPPI
jgi:hypothetical protein